MSWYRCPILNCPMAFGNIEACFKHAAECEKERARAEAHRREMRDRRSLFGNKIRETYRALSGWWS